MMKPSSKDQPEGTLHKAKVAIEKSAGNLPGNPRLEVEGKVEEAAGKFQQKLGQVEKISNPGNAGTQSGGRERRTPDAPVVPWHRGWTVRLSQQVDVVHRKATS
jgi:uncharacterized protein YjbJ (UPF0337 family)